MLPFYNIFNEWYVTQTSKKIRAIWQSKSDNSERVSETVAYGYKKSHDDPKEWIIDEPSAKSGVREKYGVDYIPLLALDTSG